MKNSNDKVNTMLAIGTKYHGSACDGPPKIINISELEDVVDQHKGFLERLLE